MKAITILEYGSTEVLQYQEVPEPKIKADQLLVKVHASSVNPVDWKIRQGQLKLITGFSFPRSLGSDLSGVVVEVGSQVRGFNPGDEVYTFLNPATGGAYGEYVAVEEAIAAAKPANMNHHQAAAVPLAATTALISLEELGQLQPGQKVLVNGASGGVGTYAVQLAKALGATVTGVCSGRNLDLVQSLGCEEVIDYHQKDFTQENKQYDLIFDAVGKSHFWQCEPVLSPQGIYVTTLPGPENIAAAILTFFWPGKKAKLVLAQPDSQKLITIKNLIEEEKVTSVIERTYPLEEIAAAHAYSEEGHAAGKIVIAVSSEE